MARAAVPAAHATGRARLPPSRQRPPTRPDLDLARHTDGAQCDTDNGALGSVRDGFGPAGQQIAWPVGWEGETIRFTPGPTRPEPMHVRPSKLTPTVPLSPSPGHRRVQGDRREHRLRHRVECAHSPTPKRPRQAPPTRLSPFSLTLTSGCSLDWSSTCPVGHQLTSPRSARTDAEHRRTR